MKASNFIKNEATTQVFSCEICEIFKNTYFKEHLQMTASVKYLFKKVKLNHDGAFGYFIHN